MKKVSLILVLAFCLLITSVVLAEPTILLLDEDEYVNRQWYYLPEVGVAFHMGDGVVSVDESDNDSIYYYFYSESLDAGLSFTTENVSSLEQARGMYSNVEPVDVMVNGLTGVAFGYNRTNDSGETQYCVDVYLEIPDRGIINAFSVSSNPDNFTHLTTHILAAAVDEKGEAYLTILRGHCTADKVNLRKTPGEGAYYGQLNRGDVLTLLSSDGEWSYVECWAGRGYIRTKYIEVY